MSYKISWFAVSKKAAVCTTLNSQASEFPFETRSTPKVCARCVVPSAKPLRFFAFQDMFLTRTEEARVFSAQQTRHALLFPGIKQGDLSQRKRFLPPTDSGTKYADKDINAGGKKHIIYDE